MFDDYHVHQHNHTSHKSVDVTIKRAPTDESVRLLKEMETAATAKALSVIRTENTAFDAVIHKMQIALDGATEYAVVFTLNGKQVVTRYRADWIDVRKNDKMKIAEGIRDAVARDIANHIAPAFKGVL